MGGRCGRGDRGGQESECGRGSASRRRHRLDCGARGNKSRTGAAHPDHDLCGGHQKLLVLPDPLASTPGGFGKLLGPGAQDVDKTLADRDLDRLDCRRQFPECAAEAGLHRVGRLLGHAGRVVDCRRQCRKIAVGQLQRRPHGPLAEQVGRQAKPRGLAHAGHRLADLDHDVAERAELTIRIDGRDTDAVELLLDSRICQGQHDVSERRSGHAALDLHVGQHAQSLGCLFDRKSILRGNRRGVLHAVAEVFERLRGIVGRGDQHVGHAAHLAGVQAEGPQSAGGDVRGPRKVGSCGQRQRDNRRNRGLDLGRRESLSCQADLAGGGLAGTERGFGTELFRLLVQAVELLGSRSGDGLDGEHLVLKRGEDARRQRNRRRGRCGQCHHPLTDVAYSVAESMELLLRHA